MALDDLIKLHETDERLIEIHELKGGLPELLNKQKSELDVINDTQNISEDKLKELNSKISSNQNSLNESSGRLEKYNDQLFSVTKTKEYEALISETDQLKTIISDLNEELSQISDEKQELEQLIESNKELIEELSNSINDNKKTLSTQMSTTEKEENLLLKHKKTLSKNIDNKFLSQYTKYIDKYGQGMADIFRNSCNHCYTQLPPQLIVEIKYDKKLITCPSCSVFLYYKNEDD